MTEKKDKEHVQELKEMIQQKQPKEPVEKVLAVFCERHAVSMTSTDNHAPAALDKGRRGNQASQLKFHSLDRFECR